MNQRNLNVTQGEVLIFEKCSMWAYYHYCKKRWGRHPFSYVAICMVNMHLSNEVKVGSRIISKSCLKSTPADYYKPQKQSSWFTFLQNTNSWHLKQTPSGTCDILHSCASVLACVIGVSFTCQFVHRSISVAIFNSMCSQRRTTMGGVFADTLSAEQMREDGVQPSVYQLDPCLKHPVKFKRSETSFLPQLVSMLTSVWLITQVVFSYES